MVNEASWAPLTRLPQIGEVYLHRNGLAYEVKALARDQDAEDILVIHQGKDGVVWSRPLGNFMGLNAEGSARFRLNQDTDRESLS